MTTSKRDLLIVVKTLCALALSFWISQVLAQPIELIQLNNRTVDEMIPIVGPLLKPGEAISGTGYKLILRASPETVAEVRRMLSELDQGLSNLLISVRQGDALDAEQSQAAASIRYNSQAGGAVSGSVVHDRLGEDWQGVQRVRVLEGNAAYIHTGVALFQPDVIQSYGGTTVTYGSQRDVGTGFYVLPRLNGNRVNLEISPYREVLTGIGTTTNVQRASTIVSGQLGDWIFVGGANQGGTATQSGILSRSNSRTERQFGIYLKVDKAE